MPTARGERRQVLIPPSRHGQIFCNEMSIGTSEAIQFPAVTASPTDKVSRTSRARATAAGGGTTETLRNLVGKKLVEDMDLATGVLGMGTF